MDWKNQLKEFENNKDWESAINFMQEIIEKNAKDMDAYISINYLLMNLLVEEDYEKTKHNYYAKLLKKYFDLSAKLFSEDATYFFYTAIIAHMSEWYFDIDIERAKEMLTKANNIDPENNLFKWGRLNYSDMSNSEFNNQSKKLAQVILSNHALVQEIEDKGSVGKYTLELLKASSNR